LKNFETTNAEPCLIMTKYTRHKINDPLTIWRRKVVMTTKTFILCAIIFPDYLHCVTKVQQYVHCCTRKF